jgi:hypothetical protein
MKSRDLMAEAFNATGNIRQAHFERLASCGVNLAALAELSGRMPIPGVANVSDVGDGLYRPDPDGYGAVIVPVTAPVEMDVFGITVATIEVIDLLAFNTANPGAWRWRVGNAWALGEDLIVSATGEPIEMVATPLDWLITGGTAACILNWSPRSPAWAHLRAGPELIVSDELLQARLTKAIERSIPLPRMRRSRCAA